MQRIERTYMYGNRDRKRQMRRQLMGNLFLLLLVLVLGAACAAAYCHARGGFMQ